MALPKYYEHVPSNYAVYPTGGINEADAGILLGGLTSIPTKFNYRALRMALAANSPDYIGWFDQFLGDTLSGTYQPDAGSGGTAAINAQFGGAVRLATGTTDDIHSTLALGLHWKPQTGLLFFEAAIRCETAITARAIEVGVSDALSETNGLAFSNHSAAGVVDVAADAVVFGYDTDASMTTWAANAVKAGTPQAVALTAAPSTSWQRLAIAIDADGDAEFFVDGDSVARIEDAITPTVLLTPWITIKNLAAATTRIIDVDFMGIFCSR